MLFSLKRTMPNWVILIHSTSGAPSSRIKENAHLNICFFVGKDVLLRQEAYEEFIDFRAEKIAEKLNEFLELGTT